MKEQTYAHKASISSGLKYGFIIIFKPFAGFSDMKNEKKGNIISSLIFIFLLILSSIIMQQYSGFIFNTNNVKLLNIIDEITKVIGPIILWCIASWCVTTLIDGEGSFKDIVMSIGYAIIPLLLTRILYTVLTNILILDEGAVNGVILSIGTIWMGLLVFSSTLTIHQFSFSKTIFAIGASIVSIGIIIFIGLLFINLIEQMYDYFYSIFREILLRL